MSPLNVDRLFADAAHHYQSGRLNEAAYFCRQVLKHRPRHVASWEVLALIAWHQGRLDEALAGFNRSIRLGAKSAERHFHHAGVLKALKRHNAALAAFNAALAINPAFVEAHLNKGNTLLELGRPEQALQSFETALKLKPGYASAHNNKGNALLALGRPGDAIACYDAAIAAYPNLAQAHHNRANALQALGQFDAAVAGYNDAIALKPDYAEAFCNKGNALQRLASFEDAVICYTSALVIDPNYAEAWSNRAVALSNLGRNAEAISDYRQLVKRCPGQAEAQYHLAVTLLRMGELKEGWPLFEARKQMVAVGEYRDTPKLWRGDDSIAGKTLLVDAEQGLGDTLQFCRYVRALEKTDARVIFSVQDGLTRLLSQSLPGVQVVSAKRRAPHFDLHLPLLSLPLALQVYDTAALADPPYLSAESALVAAWRRRIKGPGFKIGVAWQGNAKSAADPGRSFEAERFAQISSLPNVRLISLQKGIVPPAQLGIESLPQDFDVGPDAFIDTAAVMQTLDLIITSDTAIAHLAGALGRPVWVVLKHWADWRWFTDRTDSPWYPSMTLFRQPKPGDWTSVFAEIAMRLKNDLAVHD